MFSGGYFSTSYFSSYWMRSTFTPPVSGVATANPDYISLVEIDFASGTRYYSFDGVSAPSAWYKDQVLSIGNITREVPALAGDGYRVADCDIELANVDLEFSKLKASDAFRNRIVRIRFGDARAGMANMRIVFTGKITDWVIRKDRVVLQVRDTAWDKFRIKLDGQLNREDFPHLPAEQEPVLWPIVYGNCSSDQTSKTGAVPCYRVDPAEGGAVYRYLVARHACKAVVNVYRYEVLLATSEYTVTEASVHSQTMTFLDFATDPRDPERVDEIEITADVQGVTANGLSSGTLIENPVEQLRHYLLNYAACTSGELSTTHFGNAIDNAVKASYTGAFALVGEAPTHEEVINRFCESFNMSFFVTRDGLFAPFLFWIDDLSDVVAATTFVSDQNDILRDSFEIFSNDRVASRLQYNFSYNWVKDYFERQPDYLSQSQEDALGQDIRDNVNLWFTRLDPVAANVVSERLWGMRENQEFVRFNLPIAQFLLDLNDYLRLTHFCGVKANGAGYERAVFKVLRLGVTVQPRSMMVACDAAKLFDNERVWLTYMRLFDATEWPSVTWGTANATQKEYAFLGDDTDPTGHPKGTLGTSDPIKLLF